MSERDGLFYNDTNRRQFVLNFVMFSAFIDI